MTPNKILHSFMMTVNRLPSPFLQELGNGVVKIWTMDIACTHRNGNAIKLFLRDSSANSIAALDYNMLYASLG